jgi:hypothetical protein
LVRAKEVDDRNDVADRAVPPHGITHVVEQILSHRSLEVAQDWGFDRPGADRIDAHSVVGLRHACDSLCEEDGRLEQSFQDCDTVLPTQCSG